jgi:hypothetical protein
MAIRVASQNCCADQTTGQIQPPDQKERRKKKKEKQKAKKKRKKEKRKRKKEKRKQEPVRS